MNAFTDMRQRYLESESNESFAEYYLAHRCYVDEQDDAARYQLRNKIASLRALYSKDFVSETDLLGLLASVGENPYLDRYMLAFIIQQKHQLLNHSVQSAMISMLSDAGNSPQRMVSLFDICIACDLPLLSNDRLYEALLTCRHDYDAFSVLLEYILHFSITNFAELLYGYLEEGLPVNLNLQMIDVLIACYPNITDLRQYIQQKLIPDSPMRSVHMPS